MRKRQNITEYQQDMNNHDEMEADMEVDMVADMKEKELEDSVEDIFQKIRLKWENNSVNGIEGKDNGNECTNNHEIDRIYPELILQLDTVNHANKYMASFQRHHRQFINTAAEETAVLRWKTSTIASLQGLIVEQSFLGNKGGSAEDQISSVSGHGGVNERRRAYLRPASSALFSWSSNDAYIEARKQELLRRGRKVSSSLEHHDNDDEDESIGAGSDQKKEDSLIDKVGMRLPNDSTMNRLNTIIDKESNKFIHERIQIIKAHHSEQISKKINERKRKDHELHLQRLKAKEEQYELEMRAATEEKEKSNRFLGIFNFSTSENNTVMDSTDSVDKLDRSSNTSMASTAELKKRFSFLPKTNLFGSRDSERSLQNLKKEKPENDLESSEIEEKEEKQEETEEVKEDNKEEAKKANSKTNAEESLRVDGQDLDLIFKVPNNFNNSDPATDLDEFEEFQSTPPPQPKKEEKIITSHKFLPMSEPTPLINLDNDESLMTPSESSSKNDKKSSSDQDLLIL